MRRTAQRTGTTVVAVVGDDASECVRRLGEAANVVPVSVDDDPPLDRAVATWSEATRAHTPYLVHDADPLAAVADAWVRHYDEQGPIGELEVAVAETLAQVLKQCGDDITRENVMKQAQSLKEFRSSVTLPGIAITTRPTDFRPLKEMRLVQFDGTSWQPIGQLFDSAFTGAGGASGTTGNAR